MSTPVITPLTYKYEKPISHTRMIVRQNVQIAKMKPKIQNCE